MATGNKDESKEKKSTGTEDLVIKNFPSARKRQLESAAGFHYITVSGYIKKYLIPHLEGLAEEVKNFKKDE